MASSQQGVNMARSLLTHHSARWWYRRGLASPDATAKSVYAAKLQKAGFAAQAAEVLATSRLDSPAPAPVESATQPKRRAKRAKKV